MRHQDIIDRLKAAAPSLRIVAGAASYMALKDGAIHKSPSAYVVPGNSRAQPNSLATGAVRQTVSPSFSVLLGFRQAGGQGERGIDAFDDVEDEIIDALMGWKPPNTSRHLEFVGRDVMGLDRKVQTVWFGLKFSAQRILQKTGGPS